MAIFLLNTFDLPYKSQQYNQLERIKTKRKGVLRSKKYVKPDTDPMSGFQGIGWWYKIQSEKTLFTRIYTRSC